MHRQLIPASVIVLFGALAFGCASPTQTQSSGRLIDSEKVASIVKGTTTRAEVETMFGKPDYTSMMPDGKRTLSYQYSETKARVSLSPVPFVPISSVKGDTHTQSLMVIVTKDGIVEDYEFNDSRQKFDGGPLGTMTTRPQ